MESITPKVLFMLFGMPIRSTVVATWIAMALIILSILLLNRFQTIFTGTFGGLLIEHDLRYYE